MAKLSFKIAYPIIIAGLFIIVAFIALNYQTISLSFYIVLSLLIIYIFLFGFATGQNFAIPIRKLLQKADDLSKGDLKSRFYSQNKDELGELARVFNKIAEDLEQTKSENETTEKSVDLKVKVRTQDLEETINALEQKVKNRSIEFQNIVAELEKFQQQSKAREAQEADLKNQVAELREKLEEKTPKKKNRKKVKKTEQVQENTIE